MEKLLPSYSDPEDLPELSLPPFTGLSIHPNLYGIFVCHIEQLIHKETRISERMMKVDCELLFNRGASKYSRKKGIAVIHSSFQSCDQRLSLVHVN